MKIVALMILAVALAVGCEYPQHEVQYIVDGTGSTPTLEYSTGRHETFTAYNVSLPWTVYLTAYWGDSPDLLLSSSVGDLYIYVDGILKAQGTGEITYTIP